MLKFRQGIPLKKQGKSQWKKGDSLGGFTFPFDVFGDLSYIFARFGLWENDNGICVAGREHKIFMKGNYYTLYYPAKCGDIVDGKTVKGSNCRFDALNNLYVCDVFFGELATKAESEDFEYLDELEKIDEKITESLVDLVSGLFDQVLPLCVCPANGPLNTAPAKAVMQSLLEKTKSDIMSTIKEGNQKKWH